MPVPGKPIFSPRWQLHDGGGHDVSHRATRIHRIKRVAGHKAENLLIGIQLQTVVSRFDDIYTRHFVDVRCTRCPFDKERISDLKVFEEPEVCVSMAGDNGIALVAR